MSFGVTLKSEGCSRGGPRGTSHGCECINPAAAATRGVHSRRVRAEPRPPPFAHSRGLRHRLVDGVHRCDGRHRRDADDRDRIWGSDSPARSGSSSATRWRSRRSTSSPARSATASGGGPRSAPAWPRFAVASAIAGAAPDGPVLIAARALQGIGGRVPHHQLARAAPRRLRRPGRARDRPLDRVHERLDDRRPARRRRARRMDVVALDLLPQPPARRRHDRRSLTSAAAKSADSVARASSTFPARSSPRPASGCSRSRWSRAPTGASRATGGPSPAG